MTRPEAHRLLSYLASRDWLIRLKRGLYSLVPLSAEHPKMWIEHPWLVAVRIYGPDCYLGGWSACEHWELTDQTFRDTMVVTSQRIRRRKEVITGFPILARQRKPEALFGITQSWCMNVKMPFSDPSRTLVDVMADPTMGGGMRHVGDMLETYFYSEHLDEDLLCDYIEQFGNRTIFKRLGYLSEIYNVGSDDLARRCREGMSSGVGLLDPTSPARGPILRKWNLRVNSSVAPGPYF